MTEWMKRPSGTTLSGLAMLIVLIVADLVHERQLNRQLSTRPQRDELSSWTRRVEATELELRELKQQPAAISAKAFAVARDKIEERLARFEQVSTDAPVSKQDLSALQNRLEALEARTAQALRRAPAKPGRSPPSLPAAPAEPPFQLLGTELRGGEQFLSLLPEGARSLAQVRVLRPGDAEGAWQLEAIDSSHASFRVDGQVRLLALP